MPRLTEQGKNDILRYLDADKPLPDNNRFLLFDDKREAEPVWNGETCAIIARVPFGLSSGWSDENFYLAFRLGGVTTADLRSTRNFVEYDHGRAWGEDLCEVLIQPIYIDNSAGPTLHIVAKPGGEWVEQQSQPDGSWQPFEASGVRYASTVDAGQQVWRGELAIPWQAIESPSHGRPALLRFNFIQHQNSTGQSASWAGPIDQSRDGKIAGLVMVKETMNAK